MQDRRVRAASAVLAAVVTLGLAGCGISSPSRGAEDTGSATAAPALADVEPLTDPRSWQGASTAAVPDPGVRPVAEDVTPELPVTVTDAQGTRVQVSDASRILALDVYGTLSRTVFELGLGDRVVGRDVSSQFEEAAGLPLVTQTGHDLSAEAILDLNPTVLLTDTTLGPWDAILQVRAAGIPVVVVDSHRGLDNLRELTLQVADALGVHEQGVALAQRTQDEVDAVAAQIAKVAPADQGRRLRMVFLYVRGQSGVYYMFGEGSGADGLIDALGGYDVAEEIGWDGMKPVTDEGLVDAQPDLVLMMTKGLDSAGGVEGLLDRMPALASTPAGENRRVVDMVDSQILGYGPLSGSVLNALAVAVYAPEALS